MSAVLTNGLPLHWKVADDDAPRPEYPRPQFERQEWLSLNGDWEFEFDDQNVGLEQNWATRLKPFGRNILVPFCFESRRSGIADPGPHPQAWYRRRFNVPANWSDQRILLHFGAVDYRASVWVNGQFVGEHEGGHTPFRFEITPCLKAGPNTLTVRVEDPPSDRYIPRGKQHWQEKPESIFYTRTSGIWQTVWLEPVSESYLDRVRIDAATDGCVTFDGRISRSMAGLELRATVSYQGRVIVTSIAACDGSQATPAAFIRDPKWWSPDSPNLYDVTFELIDGSRVLDRVDSYFGFRSISTQDGRVLLNGAPTYLKMVLDQGYWPDSNLTPPSDDAIFYDIRWSKVWALMASASTRRSKTRDSFTGRTAWGCWSRPRCLTRTCSMTNRWFA
jgi:beta-galactosidase/beta-glucuronidase